MAAAASGKFWDMHDKLLKSQLRLDVASLRAYGVDVDVGEAIAQSRYASQIKRDQDEAARFGARRTPSVFINGRPLSGAVGLC
jgi:protein-disulfide isomerase